MSKFPNIVDVAASPISGPVGSRHNRRKVRIIVEGSPALKSRLDALAFESGLTIAEIGRYALWSAVLDAEPNQKRFCQKVARERLNQVQQERIKPC